MEIRGISKRIIIGVIATLGFACINFASAQKSKADTYFYKYNYKDAIPLYLKVIAKSPNDTNSLIHLAYSYSVIKDYTNAEIFYSRVASMNGIAPIVHYNYAKTLKYNGKIDDARNELAKYLSLVPSDTAAKSELNYYDRLKQSYDKEYQVTTINNINSEYSEFSPVLYSDSLVFVSDRSVDMLSFAKNKYNGSNYFKVFVAAPAHGGFSSPTPISAQINGSNNDYNIGPVCFAADGSEIFYTEVAAIQRNGFVNRMKLYSCKRSGGKWAKRVAFTYNSDDYSVMHPALSPDGKRLFYTSDMPGGFGGMDIYVCTRTADGWSKPQNLGSQINTSGNECFPYMRSDGILYLSSDKHFNYGGLDIFSCKELNGVWTNLQNLGADVNSSSDDFGICFNKNNRTGYFSSNRKGGIGKDDIYSFTFTGDYLSLQGMVLCSFNRKDIAAGIEVTLYTEDGVMIGIAKTDSLGSFKFNNLPGDQEYMLKVNENDPRFAGRKRFFLADKDGRIVGISKASSKFNYSFAKLPPDLTKMNKIDAAPANFAGNIIRGDGTSTPLTGVKIDIVDTTGKVTDSAETNEFGSFLFSEVSPDGKYDFKVYIEPSKIPPCPKIFITDRQGNIIKELYLTVRGNYEFRVLASDTTTMKRLSVDDAQLRYKMKAGLLDQDKKAVSSVKVRLYDNANKFLFTTSTDSTGSFTFNDLPADKTFMVEIDTNDIKMKGITRLYLTDSKGNIVRELKLGKDYKFAVLPPDFKKMGSVYAYDPWLTALNLKNNSKEDKMEIIENIYFDYQKWDVLPAAANTLTKVVQVMKANPEIKIELDAYTDPRGSAEFNLLLSQKRADAAVAYMVKNGISSKRVSGKGFGKTHPINNCGDPNARCSEEEYGVNRRIEFKITKTQK